MLDFLILQKWYNDAGRIRYSKENGKYIDVKLEESIWILCY